LIVEDEDDASYLLGRLLRLAPPYLFAAYDGINILKARSAEQALEILGGLASPDAQQIDLVLLDLVLGGLSGYAVLSEMERCVWLRTIPVCVITGQVASGDRLITPYLTFTRKNGLAARELAEAMVALTKIALPGIALGVQ
jgi:CheY-like chemotaxis protein